MQQIANHSQNKRLRNSKAFLSVILQWCGLGDSNSWPLPWQGSALTTELNPHVVIECDYTEGKWLIQGVL